jgi:hypothetical protein
VLGIADVKLYRGPPMTLGAAAAAGVRLIVWCKECRHQVEPDPAKMAARYGAETSVLDWRERLVCFRPAGRYGGDRNEAMIGEKSFCGDSGEERWQKRWRP